MSKAERQEAEAAAFWKKVVEPAVKRQERQAWEKYALPEATLKALGVEQERDPTRPPPTRIEPRDEQQKAYWMALAAYQQNPGSAAAKAA